MVISFGLETETKPLQPLYWGFLFSFPCFLFLWGPLCDLDLAGVGVDWIPASWGFFAPSIPLGPCQRGTGAHSINPAGSPLWKLQQVSEAICKKRKEKKNNHLIFW